MGAAVEEVLFGNPMEAGLVLDHPSPPLKKKRNLPGNPDPEAEVVALSPRSLMATNRFVCEICGKGFQRDQNLQLHRRGHNLPWKLKQRNTAMERRKRVYVCPEVTCVHHHPSRALGDLTGIKKHFCRKHGDKKWKCDKCGKRYAVHSDCKAHSKTCGTREYKCHCGTLFSRRDSFITHRAFCDALAEETAKMNMNMNMNMMGYHFMGWMDHQKTTAMRSSLAPSSTAYNEIITTTSMPLMDNDNTSNNFVFDQTLNSATALLQKAAQVGATTSSSSFPHPQQPCVLYSQPSHSIYPPPPKRRRIHVEDETRDFLGGGVYPICQPSTVNGWI